MKAAIITIGDEILIGQITDTNSSFIAKALDTIGIETFEMASVSDSRQHILDALTRFQDSVELVVVTGGLGPTKDDITKKTFCDYFEDVLIEDSATLDHVTALIEQYYKRPITQLNKDQALVPSTAVVLRNDVGTAPGIWMKKGNTVFVSLPGVPYEMKQLVENHVIPKLLAEFNRPYIIHKTLLTYGIGESLLAERIASWEDELPGQIKLAYLPSPGRVRLRLTARGKDKEALEKEIARQIEKVTRILGDDLVGLDDTETLEMIVGKLLTSAGKTIGTAESCTGGKIAQILTSIPGSSKYYLGSIVSYAAEVKVDVLGVQQQTIRQHTVVSAEVAKEMAVAARRILKTDYALSTTGNAGPAKDDTDKEVGVVFIALASAEGVEVEEFNFGQPREKVIDRTVNKSLEMLRKEILKKG